MEQSIKQERVLWIDCIKFVAILAVITNHLQNIAYSSGLIESASFFSVTVFVLASGITSFYSIQRHIECSVWTELGRKLRAILIPYMIATFLYQIVFERFFSIHVYLRHLIKFDASGPFYFVAFYIQLILVAPLLYKLLIWVSKTKHVRWGYVIIFGCILLVSVLAMNYTSMFDSYGGARYLLGGTYLVVYLLGMFFAHMRIESIRIKAKKSIFIGLCSLCIIYFCYIKLSQFALDKLFPFGEGRNPPGILLIGYAVLVFAVLFSFFSILEQKENKVVKMALLWMAKIGQNSLFIFLYHELFLRIIRFCLKKIGLSGFNYSLFIYVPLMILGPVALKVLYEVFRRRVFDA